MPSQVVLCAYTEAIDAKAAKTIDDRTIMYRVNYIEVKGDGVKIGERLRAGQTNAAKSKTLTMVDTKKQR